jgi:non-heme chloroperoxidase
VFLHGVADSWHSFERILPQLSESMHAFALTQRGHGDSSRPVAGYSVREFSADLEAFMDELLLEAAVIVGHSMGSAVAQRFAIDHGERTLGLVLVGASVGIQGGTAAREFWDTTLRNLADPVDRGLVRGMVENMLVQPVPPEFVETLIQESLKVPARVWRAVFEGRWHAEGDFSGQLGHIRPPTLVVWGDQDSRYPRSIQEALVAQISGSRLVVYPGCGHAPHWEEPERFAGEVNAFVESL